MSGRFGNLEVAFMPATLPAFTYRPFADASSLRRSYDLPSVKQPSDREHTGLSVTPHRCPAGYVGRACPRKLTRRPIDDPGRRSINAKGTIWKLCSGFYAELVWHGLCGGRMVSSYMD
jgi:hypothetical protein